MGMFTTVSQDVFNELQVDAGVILNNFDPANPAAPDDEDIVTATTGGITVACVPTYSDYFADIDNVPNNMKEGKHLDGWDCTLTATALGTTPETIKLALGAADIDGTDTSKIIPRRNLAQTDFQDLWWVGDKADGGMVAVQIKNALSTGGFSLKTTKNGKGQLTLTLMGHVSISDQNTMPMVFYSTSGATLGTLTVTSVAGSSSGKTKITVSGHTLGTGEGYVYKVASTAQEIAYGDDLTSWTDWNGSADITATNGQKITVAVVDSNDKAVAVGSATVVSAT